MKFRFLIASLCLAIKSFANVSDTIHVSHYSITLDTMDYTAHTIKGMTELTVHAKMNGVNNISLGLYILTIDSIKSSGVALAYSYNDTTIHIAPAAVMNVNDSIVIQVYYHGAPKTDGSFGGFYFATPYAYNIGVGFDADPHNFARTWFPCIDEFTDRSTYEFHIKTRSSYKAFCNGTLQSEVTNPDSTKTWNWVLDQTIPPYLAAIAVAPFYTMHRNYQGIPVEFGVLPADSAHTISTFVHLDSAIMNDIAAWGPYPWDKIGYVMVPFAAGAMEHATSIHAGKSFINGTLTYETSIMAHELSHMWFGDLVTCRTEQDMWLNEGWATFNENFFTGFIYGQQAYENNRRAMHRKVVMYDNIRDGGYYAMNAVPHAATYSHTPYEGGSDILHSIRRFLGDSLFFPAVRSYLNNRAFSDVSSDDFRDELAAASGISMTDYFSTIVAMQGFPHVSVDSFTVTPNGGNFDVAVFTREKMKGNNLSFMLPVEMNFTNAANDTIIPVTVNAFTNSFLFTLPFAPEWVGVDRSDKLSDAVVDYTLLVTDTGTYDFPETYSTIRVLNQGSGNSTVRLINNYVTPDPFMANTDFVRLSDYHYYKVEGIFAPGFLAKGNFGYDGSTSSYVTSFLDNTLINGTAKEDSLLIYYRPHAGMNWELVNGYTINFNGSHNDKRGWMVVDTLKAGEYVLGVRDVNTGLEGAFPERDVLSAVPNPAADHCSIGFKVPAFRKSAITIYDVTGRIVFSTPVFSHQEKIDWDTYYISNGTYLMTLITEGEVVATEKIVVDK
ncbi:MAG TPA: M1 family aminopeptidase [Chitinophagaceae bacterium]|nr:M1 family aminopeptidase [Chitinophagaceae bacterium]